MARFSNIFGGRLTPSVAIVSAIGLVLGGVLVGLFEEELYRNQRMDEVRVQGEILAASVTAALVFNDARAAQTYVDALTINPELQAAGVYDAMGNRVAGFMREGGAGLPDRVEPMPATFSNNRVIAALPVRQNGMVVGTVYLRALTDSVERRLVRYGGIFLLVTMGLLLLAVVNSAQRDLSARAHALAEANARLVSEMAERAKAEDALRQSQKMEAIGQLSGGIAHDFNNLLTIVVGNLDALLERKTLPPDVRERMQMALSASLRGADLTRQLLAFSRKQQLTMQACDANKIVAHAAQLLGRTLRGNIEIRCHLDDGLSAVMTDPAQVESAIANLTINARDAMPEGGTITIETANKVLDETYAAQNADVTPGEYAMIAVTDTGSGIPASVLARVFEPFFTTKEFGKGSGLGLSMVYGFLKQSGGHVKIYSEEGRGTTVRLYLPKADAAMAQGSETILIVEDDPMVRDMAVKGLRDLGYSVLEAENGAKALHILQNGRPIDLLFTDVVMPGGMSGADLAKHVVQERPGLKVLFTSGFAEASFHNGSRSEALSPILSKPYRYNELARMVRNVLNG